MISYLSKFKILRPLNECAQESLLDWIARVHCQSEAISQKWKTPQEPAYVDFYAQLKHRLFSIGLGNEKIASRGVQIEDCLESDFERMRIYRLNAQGTPQGLKERMLYFDQIVTQIFEDFYPIHSPIEPHLIHVTCTGYVAPNGAQKLISKRELGNQIQVTNAYHMGCYASIPSIRMAIGQTHGFDQNSDIIHTEISSLHFNPLVHTTEQLVVQSLFADGFIKYTVSRDQEEEKSFKILAIHEEILPKSTEKMTWQPQEWGFQLSLSKDIPILIAQALENYLLFLGKKAGVEKEELMQAYFAIHPGGPKIIELIANRLNLSPTQIFHSQTILKQYGNMSSATLPHIWEKMLNDSEVKARSLIVSLAFGPGLSITGALFEKC